MGVLNEMLSVASSAAATDRTGGRVNLLRMMSAYEIVLERHGLAPIEDTRFYQLLNPSMMPESDRARCRRRCGRCRRTRAHPPGSVRGAARRRARRVDSAGGRGGPPPSAAGSAAGWRGAPASPPPPWPGCSSKRRRRRARRRRRCGGARRARRPRTAGYAASPARPASAAGYRARRALPRRS